MFCIPQNLHALFFCFLASLPLASSIVFLTFSSLPPSLPAVKARHHSTFSFHLLQRTLPWTAGGGGGRRALTHLNLHISQTKLRKRRRRRSNRCLFILSPSVGSRDGNITVELPPPLFSSFFFFHLKMLRARECLSVKGAKISKAFP